MMHIGTTSCYCDAVQGVTRVGGDDPDGGGAAGRGHRKGVLELGVRRGPEQERSHGGGREQGGVVLEVAEFY